MSLGMACGVLAIMCLVLRFAERRVKKMTLLCIIFLSMHELINISAVTTFAVLHRFNDGFTYGQPFWMTVCSTILSIATNITLIIDYNQTKAFAKCGSGLTHKQRSLVVIIIVLLCYLTFGSFIQTFLLKTTFLDALYFTVVTIEAIGFGDIHPTSTGTRIFTSLYISGGMVNIALAVALSREALLEAAAAGFRERVKKLRAQQRKRHIRDRWRAAVKWRLRAKNLPLWIEDDHVADDSRHHQSPWWTRAKQACSLWWRKLSLLSEDRPCYAPSHKHLNLNALTESQLEAAALEAGAPLEDLLPTRLETPAKDGEKVDIQPQPLLTHMRIGGMVSLLGQFAIAFTHSRMDVDIETVTNHDEDSIQQEQPVRERLGVPFTRTLTMQDDESFLKELEAEERIAFIARLSIACLIFIVFWAVGSAIFMKTEGWTIGTAVYFCFIAFSTVGYGDFSPKTQAGRSIFVVWALIGVATMTTLISIITEAYSKSYKSAIKTEMNNARSSTEDAFTRQRFLDSRTVASTGTEQEFSPYPPLPSQFRNPTFPCPRNDLTCKIPGVPLTRKAECDTYKQTRKHLTTLSLDILRRAEHLHSLLRNVEDSEQPENVAYINQAERMIQDIVAAATRERRP
ncbi:voltage-gated potassium channel [Phlegmacium glaucopus]|nr:voltage-gated potassium channel [Phlegmacium glaucopus]